MHMKTVAGLIAAASLLAAGTSFASDTQDVQSQSVQVMYPDLDLNTNKGTKLLFVRLQDAARAVCGSVFDTPYLTERHEINQCQQAAVENAVMHVDRPRLTALYDK